MRPGHPWDAYGNPQLIDMLDRVARRVGVVPDTALDPAGAVHERDLMADSCLFLPDVTFAGWSRPGVPELSPDRLAAAFASTLRLADVILWRAELMELAMRGFEEAWVGAPCPAWAAESRCEYWTLDRDMHWPPGELAKVGLAENFTPMGFVVCADPDTRDLAGTGWGGFGGNVLTVSCIFMPQDGHPLSVKAFRERDLYNMCPRVKAVCRAAPGQPLCHNSGQFLAGAAFLRTTVAHAPVAEVPRGDRRRYQKANKRDWPVVRVVTLRKSEEPGTRHREDERRDFSCHFLVAGHWRKNHWHPESPIWVRGHVKGDLSRPFKRPARVVFDVKR